MATLLNIQNPTLRLPDSEWVAESGSRWLAESFFDYEYLREFEAKSGTARKVVCGI